MKLCYELVWECYGKDGIILTDGMNDFGIVVPVSKPLQGKEHSTRQYSACFNKQSSTITYHTTEAQAKKWVVQQLTKWCKTRRAELIQ